MHLQRKDLIMVSKYSFSECTECLECHCKLKKEFDVWNDNRVFNESEKLASETFDKITCRDGTPIRKITTYCAGT